MKQRKKKENNIGLLQEKKVFYGQDICSSSEKYVVALLSLAPLQLVFNLLLQYHPWIPHSGHKKKGNDHRRKKLLIVKQIPLVSILGNVWRILWKIWILLGWKRFIKF